MKYNKCSNCVRFWRYNLTKSGYNEVVCFQTETFGLIHTPYSPGVIHNCWTDDKIVEENIKKHRVNLF